MKYEEVIELHDEQHIRAFDTLQGLLTFDQIKSYADRALADKKFEAASCLYMVAANKLMALQFFSMDKAIEKLKREGFE